MKEPAIVASVLGADYARLGREVAELEAAGVDRVQWDIMDGRFLPNLCFGADVVAAFRGSAEDPDPWLQPFADAGCHPVLVHAEACRQLHRTLSGIRSLGVRSGVALTPATPLERVRHVLDQVDVVRRLIERTGLPTSSRSTGMSAATPPGGAGRSAAAGGGFGHPRASRGRAGGGGRAAPLHHRRSGAPGGEGGALTGMQRQSTGVATGADKAWTE
jgi:hypothetical protein